jgi:hypothetical protein
MNLKDEQTLTSRQPVPRQLSDIIIILHHRLRRMPHLTITAHDIQEHGKVVTIRRGTCSLISLMTVSIDVLG